MLAGALASLFILQPPVPAQQSPGLAQVDAGAVSLEGPAEIGPVLEELASRARQFVPRIARSLGVEDPRPIRAVVLPRGGADPGSPLASLDASVPDWAAGYALSADRLLVIRLSQADRYPYGDPAGVLAHEVAHVLIADAAGGGERVPRWFNEGVATLEQRRWSFEDTLVYSSNLLIGPLPTLSEMDQAFRGSSARARVAYAGSFDFVRWASREYGRETVREVLEGARSDDFYAAWEASTGVPLAESESDWRQGSLLVFRWLPALASTGTLWLVVVGVFFVAAWRRRQKTREMMEKWEEDEAVLAAPRPLRSVSEPPPEEPDPRRSDDGGWVH